MAMHGHGFSVREKWRKAKNVVSPENTLQLNQVGLQDKRAFAGRLQRYAAKIYVQRVFHGSQYQVGVAFAQFLVDLVTHIGGHGDHGRSNTHAQRDGQQGHAFAALLAAKRFEYKTKKHYVTWRTARLAEQDRRA